MYRAVGCVGGGEGGDAHYPGDEGDGGHPQPQRRVQDQGATPVLPGQHHTPPYIVLRAEIPLLEPYCDLKARETGYLRLDLVVSK